MKHRYHWQSVTMALAFLLLNAYASAQAPQIVRPAKWWGYTPSLTAFIAGHPTCDSVVEALLQINRDFFAPRVINESTVGRECPSDPSNPSTGRLIFRFTDSFPTESSHEIPVWSYCEDRGRGRSPNYDPGQNLLYCLPDNPALTKNIGDCPTCKVGNPIHPASFNKMQREVDYRGAGVFPLSFERVYNSANNRYLTTAPGLGTNWWHSYYRKLSFAGPNNGATITIISADRPDGRVFAFNLIGSSLVGEPDVVERLEKLPDGTGWQLINQSDEIERYDNSGKLLWISNRAGLAQTLTYFSSGPNAGRLQSVTDPFGRSLSFEYHSSTGFITALIDPAGGRYVYGYSDGRFNLTSVTYPDNKTRTYLYQLISIPNALTGIIDENGQLFASFGYDDPAGGRAILTEHAGGAGKVTLADGNPITVTTYISGTLSATRSYFFQRVQGVSLISLITGPACPSCGPASRNYDANGNPAISTDWIGNQTQTIYDLTRNLETSRTEALGTSLARTIATQWHPDYRLPTGVAQPFLITTMAYGGSSDSNPGNRGSLLSRTARATTDASGAAGFGATLVGTPRTWTYTYNGNGQVLSIDGPRTDLPDVTTYTYYANNANCAGASATGCRGKIETVTNVLGHVTQIPEYNAHGQPLAVTDPNGLMTSLAYDARLRLTSRSVGGEATSYFYDDAGQLTLVTLPDGSSLRYAYDAAHRLTEISDGLGNRIAYTLDLAGNRTQERVFDSANQLAQTRSRIYDHLNRLIQDIGAIGQTTSYGYDNQGNLTSIDGPLAGTVDVTTNMYDALNRLARVTDPNAGQVNYGYSGLDQLVSVSDPRDLVTSYSYDGLNNLNQQLSPDTGATLNTYDAAGNLLTQLDAKGQTTTYQYDALNRVTQIAFAGGTWHTYDYDQSANSRGRLTSITEWSAFSQVTSLTQYQYDAHGRVTVEARTINGTTYTVGYGYDGAGRLSELRYPSGRVLSYGYDALGRVNQISTTASNQGQVLVQNVQYHPFGGVKSFTLGNGQSYTRGIDQDGRVASYTLGTQSIALNYDAASRVNAISDLTNPANSNTYGYDNLDRLTQAIVPGTAFGYSYDAVGNRMSKSVGSGNEAYFYAPTSNRLSSITPFSGPFRDYVHDANGSITADGVNSYVYDARGRLSQSLSVIGATSYQVNALGQRIRKSNALGDTVFHYDVQGRLIAESSPNGQAQKEYLYLGNIPVAVIQ